MYAKVVIIGHGYTSRLGIIRSLAELNCDITVIAMVFNGAFGRFIRGEGKPIDCCSKYVNRHYYCNVTDEKGLIRLLLNKCAAPNEKVCLIPDSDFSAAVIDNNRELLKDWFVFPNIKDEAGQIEYWMNKTTQKELAKSLGLNVADGVTVEVSNKGYVLPSTIPYPCFTKALATISGGKRLMSRCNDEAQLRSVLDKISQKYNTKVLIEEFKTIDKEYAVVGFSDGTNVIIPGVIEFITNSRSHFGIAREGRVLQTDGFETVLEKFKQLILEIGFCGLFDIDFYQSGDFLYFGEVNLRFGGSGYAMTAMGVNLPAMLVRFFTGEDYLWMPKFIKGSSNYINERMCLDDFVAEYLTKKEYDRIISSESIKFVFDDKDPGPQRKLMRYYHFQTINRIRRQARKRIKHL